jgi:hypothetical protein
MVAGSKWTGWRFVVGWTGREGWVAGSQQVKKLTGIGSSVV